MKIRILGNGGAISRGLFHNAFTIDESILVETPPDIMQSLAASKVDYSLFNTIYISHFHGDHYFGFPFLAIHLFFHYRGEKISPVYIYGPEGLKEKLLHLYSEAFTDTHPSYAWISDNFIFQEITDESHEALGRYGTSFVPMEHIIPAYGFLLRNKAGKPVLFYATDTVWCPAIEETLKDYPSAVIIDCNGEKDDPVKVHCSRYDVMQYGLPITGRKTLYYATHLKEEFETPDERIICCRSGDIIEV